MRVRFACLCLLLVFSAFPNHPASAAVHEIHVAPGGDDAGAGTAPQPLATLGRARQAVRSRLEQHPGEAVRVVLAEGTYRLTAPLVFDARDGGSAEAPVVYAAAAGRSVRISGGIEIRGWKQAADGVWAAPLPPDVPAHARELFINGRRAIRARHPNQGFLRVEKVGDDRRTGFTFKAGDLAAPPDLKQLELVFLHDWSISRLPVRSIDAAQRYLTLAAPAGPSAPHYAMDHFEKHPRYFLEGSASYLDAPGEWHLDAAQRQLRYRARPGETPEQAVGVVPVASALLQVVGTPEMPVRHLHFENLHFEHCAWRRPAGGYAAGQATFHEWRDGSGRKGRKMLPAAVTFQHAEHCSLTCGGVRHTGASAVWFGRGCRANRFVGNHVADASGNGVMIGDVGDDHPAAENQVTDNLIERCGVQFYGSVAVWLGITQETRVAYNTIRHHPYTGVSVGWRWNPKPSPARRNVVEHNHIHHVMQVLSDGGGIYTLGFQPGSFLRANWIHDVPLNMGRAESNGMFLDQGTTDFTVVGNWIHGIDRSPLRFHQATQNIVRENDLLLADEKTPPVRYNNTNPKDITQIDNRVTVEKPQKIDAPGWGAQTGPRPPHRARLLDQ